MRAPGWDSSDGRGIVHGRLAEEKVLVESSYGRALLTDFRASCLVESEDAVLSCIFKEDRAEGSGGARSLVRMEVTLADGHADATECVGRFFVGS